MLFLVKKNVGPPHALNITLMSQITNPKLNSLNGLNSHSIWEFNIRGKVKKLN